MQQHAASTTTPASAALGKRWWNSASNVAATWRQRREHVGEVGVSQPLITATSTRFAVAYRSALGLRVFDGAGTRTLDPDPALFDLVTWTDRAILVWTTVGDARPRLTRLCP